MHRYDATVLYAEALHAVFEDNGKIHQSFKIVEKMKQISFLGASGTVLLGGCSYFEFLVASHDWGADENGDRKLSVEFLNVVDSDVWPVVAYYDMQTGKLSLMGNITQWMDGSNIKVHANWYW